MIHFIDASFKFYVSILLSLTPGKRIFHPVKDSRKGKETPTFKIIYPVH